MNSNVKITYKRSENVLLEIFTTNDIVIIRGIFASFIEIEK